MNTKPSTVEEFIEALKKLPPDYPVSPVYIRPKYTGEANWTMDYPAKVSGLSEMEKGEVGVPHVCIFF